MQNFIIKDVLESVSIPFQTMFQSLEQEKQDMVVQLVDEVTDFFAGNHYVCVCAHSVSS